ncbi:MAG: alpha/beta hydrolase fold domain-containing protein [Nevskia sp.]|nr:alpha/beta hydrolase fold domain-containing protein [Nevskia sp.]
MMRLHQPIGMWLLLWPVLWALWLAARGTPPLGVLAAFLLITLLLRSARYAAPESGGRHQTAAGIPRWHALLLFVALSGCALAVMGKLNRLALWLFLPAALMAASSALTGRFFGLSRSHLGIVFCIGIPMAYAAVLNAVPWAQAGALTAAGLCWVLAYNAYSAAGAPRHAIYGAGGAVDTPPDPHARVSAGLLQIASLVLLAVVGVQAERGPVFALGLVAAAGFAWYQQRLTRNGDRATYVKAFLNNHGFGAAIFLGIIWDYTLTGWAATNTFNASGLGADATIADHACTGPLPFHTAPQATVHDYGYCAQRDVTYYTPADWPHPMQLDLFTPQRDTASPVVLLLHGGHWQLGRRHLMEPIAITLARRGYVAMTVSYRLAPAARFPAQLQDAQQAVRWLRDHAAQLHADPARIGVWGFSAGAHIGALMALLRPDDPWGAPDVHIRAVVAGGTPTDLEHFNPADGLALFGVPAARDAALYHHASPLYQVSPQAPPIFLFHGSEDTEVPLQQAEVLRAALARAGAPVELDVVRGVGHAGATEAAMDSALGFLDRVLKP